MFNSSKSSGQSSSTSPGSPITSNAPIPPIPIRFPLSPILAACLNFNIAQSGGTCKYSCTTCNKVFPTTQALGGHQNAHRKERNAQFAQLQRLTEEYHRVKNYVSSPDPLRWAPPASDDEDDGVDEKIIIGENIIFSNNIISNRVIRAYEFFHFMPLAAGDMNPKAARQAFGSSGGGDGGASGSGTKKPSGYDGGASGSGTRKRLIGGDDHKKKKKAKCCADDDLKVMMPNVNLSLAIGSGDMEDPDSDLDREDGEYMYVSTPKTEEPDVTLKL